MKQKKDVVHDYFNNTNNYLNKDFGITIRKEILNDILDTQVNKNILDIGCGNGGVSLDYGFKNNLYYVDQSKEMLSLAKKNAFNKGITNISFYNCSIEKFSSKKKYDIIILFGVLAHVDSLIVTLRQTFSLLNDNGKIIIQFSDYKKILTKINMYFSDKIYKKNRITMGLINQILDNYGFKIKKKIRYSILPPGIGLLSNELLYSITSTTLNNNLLSKLGTEIICEIKKR